jgi:hypothetical protein
MRQAAADKQTGGQGPARTVDLPLIRMKDDRPGPTTTVYRPCSARSSDP